MAQKHPLGEPVGRVGRKYGHDGAHIGTVLVSHTSILFQSFLVFPIDAKSAQTKPKRPAWACVAWLGLGNKV
jgi:hypothetical protein